MSDTPEAESAAPKKKKGKMKLVVMALAFVALLGGGVGAGIYATKSGMIGGSAAAAAEPKGPKLVPKSEQKKAGAGGEGGHGGGEEAGAAASHGGKPTPAGAGGDQYASNYYALDKDFTSNLQDSVHFVQVGVAVSTPYDETVVEHIKTNEIAVRSAILMTLGDTTEDQVFTSQGKRQLQARLVTAINDTLKQKEGFGGVGNVYFTNFVVQ